MPESKKLFHICTSTGQLQAHADYHLAYLGEENHLFLSFSNFIFPGRKDYSEKPKLTSHFVGTGSTLGSSDFDIFYKFNMLHVFLVWP
jgi:hypothetical protein